MFDFTDLRTFMRDAGVEPENYWVYRDGRCVHQNMEGYLNRETSTGKRFIGLWPNSDVHTGDILENAVSKDCYRIVETENRVVNRHVYELKAFCVTEHQYQQQVQERQLERQKQGTQNIYNIDTAFNSIIGGEGNIVVNYTTTLSNLEKMVEEQPSPDSEQLKELIVVLKEALENGNQVEKGLLSRFATVLQRNSWASGSIMSAILSWLFSPHHSG